MNIYDPVMTMVLTNGKVVLVYDNGYYIRTLKGSAGTSVYDTINVSKPKGASYWKSQALKALDCTLKDILMQSQGRVSFSC
jgi:hypothetical protein